MNKSSYFIDGWGLFGPYPTNEDVKEFEENGVRYFIDLTHESECLDKYKTSVKYISYPIEDTKTPQDLVNFSKLIVQLERLYRNKDGKVYVHCRGGHGRSGILVACLLCKIQRVSADDAIEMTTKSHHSRKLIKTKWLKQLCPQTRKQREFVRNMFRPLHFYKAYKTGAYSGFSNFSIHSVDIPNFGNFPTSESAYQSYKDPENTEYVQKQIESKTPYYSKLLGKKCNIRHDWEDVKELIMYDVLSFKFSQHPSIKSNLLNTGFRQLVEHTRSSDDDSDGNMLGRLLTTLRENYYNEEINK